MVRVAAKPRLLGCGVWDLSLAVLSESGPWAQAATRELFHLLWKSSPSEDCLLSQLRTERDYVTWQEPVSAQRGTAKGCAAVTG